ncbi:MAG TPA: class I SAM-dependent methyltransferase [Actinoplanes sp.]|jgi:O-methyltransferase involved in polyketide biosynthesis
MNTSLASLTPVEASLYLTQCGRALDSRRLRPFLGDTTAGEIADRIGLDCSRFPMPASSVTDIALRAKKLDGVVRGFTARHPDAVVLDLGAGLDNRMARVAPPAGVDWYDVDFPEVAALRADAIGPEAKAHAIAADLTDPGWLDAVPTGRPGVIVADGLIAFLTRDAFVTLLHRLVDHFPSGEIAFNGYTRFHMWVLKRYRGTASIKDVVANPGFDDPREPERWEPRLRLAQEILLTRAPEVAAYPTALRLWTRLAAHSTALSRRGTTVLRYRFPA